MIKLVTPLALAAVLAVSGSANAGSVLSNDMSKCAAGGGPAIQVNVRGISATTGKIRVQNYPATKAAWMEKGKWLQRIEAKASSTALNFCIPISAAGNYAIAVRHDKNGNGKTDISSDGGGASNNPKISVFNLGKPSVGKASFYAGTGVTTITIKMQYM